MYYLVYTRRPKQIVTRELLEEITSRSLQNNKLQNITGILLGLSNRFIQYLEGDENHVKKLVARIRKDPRHFEMNVWVQGYYDERVFKDWSMGSSLLKVDELRTLPAMTDIQNFLRDPRSNREESKRFISMMNDLLISWQPPK